MAYDVKAVNTVQRTIKLGKAGDKAKGIAPTPPVTEEIKPGTVFVIDDKETYLSLKRSGAVLDHKPTKGAEEAPAKPTGGEGGSEPTKEQLWVRMEELGLTAPKNTGVAKLKGRIEAEEKRLADEAAANGGGGEGGEGGSGGSGGSDLL